LADPPAAKKHGHALPALALAGGVMVLVLLTQHAISGVIARFIGGLWVSVMQVVFGLIGGIFGG
jgi:hypothetical protein